MDDLLRAEVENALAAHRYLEIPIETYIRFNCPLLSQRAEYKMAASLIERAREMMIEDIHAAYPAQTE